MESYFRMGVFPHERFRFQTNGAIAESGSLGAATDDADMTSRAVMASGCHTIRAFIGLNQGIDLLEVTKLLFRG